MNEDKITKMKQEIAYRALIIPLQREFLPDGREMVDIRANRYLEAFSDFTEKELTEGLKRCLNQHKRQLMPTVDELRPFIQRDTGSPESGRYENPWVIRDRERQAMLQAYETRYRETDPQGLLAWRSEYGWDFHVLGAVRELAKIQINVLVPGDVPWPHWSSLPLDTESWSDDRKERWHAGKLAEARHISCPDVHLTTAEMQYLHDTRPQYTPDEIQMIKSRDLLGVVKSCVHKLH